ncbi:anoctamin 8 white walker [Arctopsyche grandis]|uniref:anoctamin 8 white walker n=1 Tax=Arctopsyche grandis TaxID=121162 RepID=UPI00406D8E30
MEGEVRRRPIAHLARDTLDNAGRLLRRKLPIGGHLITPRRLWLQSIATRQCDVVMTFPKGASDSTLLWLLRKLRSATPRLTVCVRHHPSTQTTAFYLTANFQVLLRAAEEIHLPKALRPEFGGGLKEFTLRDLHCFYKSDSPEEFLTSLERQELVLHLLEAVRATTEESAPTPLKLRPGQSVVPVCLSAGLIERVFPLHDTEKLQELREKWVRAVCSPQPLEDICEYFGVKVAMYFAWLGHYTCALVFPAVLGLFFWICLSSARDSWRDMTYVLFSVFNVLWACIYLQSWKRYSNELAYRWGTLDQRDDLLIEPRPLYQGEIHLSSVTGRPEPVYPSWKRRVWRHVVSAPIIFLCLLAVAFTSYMMLIVQDWWDERVRSRAFLSWLSCAPRIILALMIAAMDHCYFRIATWLNDKENYRLDTKYDNHLIVKVTLFQFVNSFLSLFYIAFYLQDQEKLKEQLAALLIARQVIGNLRESAWPYLLEHLKLARLSFALWGALSPSQEKPPLSFEKADETPSKIASDHHDGINDGLENKDFSEHIKDPSEVKQRNISQAELESQLFKYEGTFAEHLEMVMQLGYVVLFSSAFPLAAFCALANNLIEVRGDAFKLCFVSQRPFSRRVNSIGSWQHAMEIMVGIAVLVNCALIGLSGQVHRMFPETTPIKTILVIVALEHVMLVMVILVRLLIPDLPSWLATEMAKVEFQRREASRNTHTPSQIDSGGNSSGTSQEDLVGIDHPIRTSISDDVTITPEEKLLIGRFSVQPSEKLIGDDKLLSSDITNGIHSPDKLSIGDNDVFDSTTFGEPVSSLAGSRRVSERDSKLLFDVEFQLGSTVSDAPIPARSPLVPEIPPFRPRKTPSPTRHWPHEAEHPGVHLTVGPGGAEWVPRPLRAAVLAAREPLHRSTHCIPPVAPALKLERKEIASASSGSDPELLGARSLTPISIVPTTQSTTTTTSAETSTATSSNTTTTTASEEEKPKAKKLSPATAALVKRARSVAVFSLKLRKAREAAAAKNALQEAAMNAKVSVMFAALPAPIYGGELNLIPIEKLIQVDDVRPRTNQ